MSTFFKKEDSQTSLRVLFFKLFVLVVYEIFWNIRALKAHLNLLIVTADYRAFITMRENSKIMPNFCCHKWIINFEQKQSFRCHDIIINITPSDQWSYPGFHSQTLWPSHLVVLGEGTISPGRLLVGRPARHGVGLPTKVLQVKHLRGESSSSSWWIVFRSSLCTAPPGEWEGCIIDWKQSIYIYIYWTRSIIATSV